MHSRFWKLHKLKCHLHPSRLLVLLKLEMYSTAIRPASSGLKLEKTGGIYLSISLAFSYLSISLALGFVPLVETRPEVPI